MFCTRRHCSHPRGSLRPPALPGLCAQPARLLPRDLRRVGIRDQNAAWKKERKPEVDKEELDRKKEGEREEGKKGGE